MATKRKASPSKTKPKGKRRAKKKSAASAAPKKKLRTTSGIGHVGSKRYRSKKGYSRKGGRGITWAEAAMASGAVYPKNQPAGHPQAGQKHPKAGRPMSKSDAVAYQRPVVGFLTRAMLKQWYDPNKGGAFAKPGTKKHQTAATRFAAMQAKIANERKARKSAWLREPQFYKRGSKKLGIKKGHRKPDFTVTSDGKVKFRAGRGPYTSLRLFRGFGPKKAQVDRLVSGGFGGPLSEPGGTVKLNSKRRKRTRSSKRRPARNRSGQYLKLTTKKNPKKKARKGGKRRRKAKRAVSTGMAVLNNGRRRRRRKARKGASLKVRSNGTRRRRRRKARKSTSVRKNPVRYRRRRKGKRAALKVRANGRRRRKGRRNAFGLVKRNPLGLNLGGALAEVKKAEFWLTVAHVGVGMSGTAMLSSAALNVGMIRRYAFMPGMMGTAARGLIMGGSAVAVSGLAYAARNVKLVGHKAWLNVLVGGAVYTLSNVLAELITGRAAALIPLVSVPAARGRAPMAMSAGESMEGFGRMGGGGMGMVVSPEDLVAGESLARNVNEFSGVGDFLELSGMGSSGGSPVPIEDLRGYPGQYGGGGMGNWLEFDPNSGLVQEGFSPGNEGF